MNTDNPEQDGDDSGPPSNREEDPDAWITGDERMTGAQASYRKTLCEAATEAFDPNPSRAEGSPRIDERKEATSGDVDRGDDRGGRGRAPGADARRRDRTVLPSNCPRCRVAQPDARVTVVPGRITAS